MYRASYSVTSLVLPNFCALQLFIPNHTLISNPTCCAIHWYHLHRVQSTVILFSL